MPTEIFSEKQKEREHLEVVRVGRKIVLKWM
jgi:hypothetical protein